jgi:hypothetical protein
MENVTINDFRNHVEHLMWENVDSGPVYGTDGQDG